jgi:hypothetical protein
VEEHRPKRDEDQNYRDSHDPVAPRSGVARCDRKRNF